MARSLWSILFALNVVLLVLLAVSYPALERGTAAYALAVASLVLVTLSLAGLSVVLYVGWDPFAP